MNNDNKVVLAKDNSFLIEIWVSTARNCIYFTIKVLTLESQTWFAIGVVTIFLRMGVRLRTVGWRSLAGDDYFALFVSAPERYQSYWSALN